VVNWMRKSESNQVHEALAGKPKEMEVSDPKGGKPAGSAKGGKQIREKLEIGRKEPITVRGGGGGGGGWGMTKILLESIKKGLSFFLVLYLGYEKGNMEFRDDSMTAIKASEGEGGGSTSPCWGFHPNKGGGNGKPFVTPEPNHHKEAKTAKEEKSGKGGREVSWGIKTEACTAKG